MSAIKLCEIRRYRFYTDPDTIAMRVVLPRWARDQYERPAFTPTFTTFDDAKFWIGSLREDLGELLDEIEQIYERET